MTSAADPADPKEPAGPTTGAAPAADTAPEPPPETPQRLPLRERKKLRTRQALVDAALRLFTTQGFAETTLDQLVDAVEVSKRTFFRAFSGKEDVALAPEKELWDTYRRRIEASELDGPLLTAYQDALIAAIADMSDGWEGRFLVSRALADRTPALTAHSLQHCAEVTDAVVATVVERLPAERGIGALPARLLLELMVAAWRNALREWSTGAGRDPATAGADDREALRASVRASFTALPAVAPLLQP
ncbi:TetR/AcrR family transcriptional regulator [Streptomyces sp. HSW2009]|uniref:TetR/AcrR family transcriptional regulator n=1 Tax=Streptomyces sp. HSW2009 TaxID=3142890 RepID=UPI0032EC694B